MKKFLNWLAEQRKALENLSEGERLLLRVLAIVWIWETLLYVSMAKP